MQLISIYLFTSIALLISVASLHAGSLYNLSHNLTAYLYIKKHTIRFNIAPVFALLLFLHTFFYLLGIRLLNGNSDFIITILSFALHFTRLLYVLFFLDKNRELSFYHRLSPGGELLDVLTNSFGVVHTLLVFLK